MKKIILYISTSKIKTKTVLETINSNEDWLGIAAYSELEAVQQFLEYDISMVIFAYDIKREVEHELTEYFKKIKSDIILLDPYGGGTSLLNQEIRYAFESASNSKLIS